MVPLFVDLNYYFVCEILFMHRESVYNQTVSEEGRKHDLLRVCGVSNSSCRHSKESQISGPTVIKHMVLVHTTLQAVR